MGYGATSLALLLGVSIMFWMYSSSFDTGSSEQGNYSAPMNSLTDNLAVSSDVGATNTGFSIITRAFLGAGAGAILAGTLGGGFASIYLIPAAAIGFIIGGLSVPLDMMNTAFITNAMPMEIRTIFYIIMTGLLFVTVVSFIRGDF